MRPLVRLWWGKGLKAIIHLNNGIVNVRGELEAIAASALVKLDLKNAGFIVNVEKSSWVPSQVIEWLGFQIEFAHFLCPWKRSKLYELCSTIS